MRSFESNQVCGLYMAIIVPDFPSIYWEVKIKS